MNLLASVNPWDGVPVGEHLFYFSPLIVLVCTMLAVVICPIIAGRGPRKIAGVALVGIIVAFVMTLRVARSVADGGMSGLSPSAGAGMLIADNLSCWFQLLVLFFAGCITWLWWIGSVRTERDAPEFFILLLGSAVGMTLMVSTTNLLMIIIAIEIASLPSYALVGFNKRDGKGAEASLKYMVFGAISAAMMLYGISLLYGMVGSLSAADVATFVFKSSAGGGMPAALVLGLACFMAGIAFKVSAVPFHFWCPDAFEGAKIEVTTWLSVVSKAAGLFLLIRLMLVCCRAVPSAQLMSFVMPVAWAIGILATITCTFGNFAAYRQQSVKRLLAYSSIAHAGYMLMTAAVFLHPDVRGAEVGVTALLIYVAVYLFMNLGAFGVVALVSWETGSDDISAFTGLGRRAPWLAVPMVICLMSLVGIPPFAGFIAKWWVLVALGKMGTTLGWFLVIVAVLNTLISLYYYMRVVVQMTLRDDGAAEVRPPVSGLAMVNLCAVMLVVLFVAANPLKAKADRYSKNLFTPATSVVVAQGTIPSDQELSN